MSRRVLGFFAVVALAAFLVSCSDPDGGPGAAERASLGEATEGLNALMADVVSLAGGLASNSVFTEGGGFPGCMDCGLDSEVMLTFFPGIYLGFYEYSDDWEPMDLRLAAGTFTYNQETGKFDHDAQPADALIVRWPHARSGDAMEVRADWKEMTQVRAYDHEIYFPYVPYVPTYLLDSPYFLVDQELNVPSQITVSAAQGGTEIVHLDIEQTWAETTCGRLFEYRTVSASGFFRSGSQVVELDRFEFDHSRDETIAVSLVGSVASGSLRLPFSAAADFTAGAVGRNPQNCQLNDIEGPFTGSFDLRAGSGAAEVGLAFDWAMTFEDGDLERLSAVELESAKLMVGRKYVDITGSLDADDIYGYSETVPLLMTFADRSSYPIADFFLGLSYPDLP